MAIDKRVLILLAFTMLALQGCDKANSDKSVVDDKEVEMNLNNRMNYFIQLYGSKENLEKTTGKTIQQLKEDYRQVIKDQIIAEKLQKANH